MNLKGNETLAQMIEARGCNPEIFQRLTYGTVKIDDSIERTTVRFSESLMCPIHCLCDGYYMSWYGDYGGLTFECSWKTSVTNLPYQSPYYLYEKVDVLSKHQSILKEFNSALCRKNLLKCIQDSDGYDELEDSLKDELIEYITNYYGVYLSEELEEYEKEVDELQQCYAAAGEDQTSWVSSVREVSDDNRFISCEVYDLYDIGDELPLSYFIVLYVLSIVAEDICKNEQQGLEENNV